jgi:hypothetical protein
MNLKNQPDKSGWLCLPFYETYFISDLIKHILLKIP